MTRSEKTVCPGLGFILLRLIGAPPLASALAMVSSYCWLILLLEMMKLELLKLASTTIKQYDQVVALLIPMC